ncbi:hypothetical protein CYY_001081 [Polysphondylium violaceum]|uniref:Cyclin-like domain-containing protein n=1 Tax=Polysphondylium violaceum TaxID=133409 RepID=A0A8J4Q0E9_9MYCE|nr:hypothetical protein CYY_001081 [Polysphondylium violaceum]
MDHNSFYHQSNNTYSHSANYYQDRPTRNQISTQYPSQTPVTILSILKDKRIQLGEISNSWGENGDWLLRSLVMAINQLLSINDEFPNNYSHFLPEHMKLPMITIEGYISRIIKYSPCSKECFIIILMYIDRLIQKRNFIVNSYNIHRILITSVLIAAKYLDDIFYNNQFYSQVGGVTVKEINIMELDFLKLLSFDLSANSVVYSVYLSHFESYTQKIQTELNFKPNIESLPTPFHITEGYIKGFLKSNSKFIPEVEKCDLLIDYTSSSTTSLINNQAPNSINTNSSSNNNNNNNIVNNNNNSSNNNRNNNITFNQNNQQTTTTSTSNGQNQNNNNNNQNNNNYHHNINTKSPLQTFRFHQPQPNCVA